MAGVGRWPQFRPVATRTSVARGFLFGLMPCGTLQLQYSLAILSAGAFSGALILFGHAVMSMPALAWGRRLGASSGRIARGLRVALVGLCVYNLLQLGTGLFVESNPAHHGTCLEGGR